MEKKSVTCNACGTRLTVTNRSGKPAVSVACPKCGTRLTVSFDPVADGGGRRTTLAAGDVYKYRIGSLLCNGYTYQLSLGQNTIGRASFSSTALIQIATADPYMSRSHAIIEITRMEGGMLKTVLSNWQNSNPTYVNGQKRLMGDVVPLNHNDVIQMGQTMMRFIVRSVME